MLNPSRVVPYLRCLAVVLNGAAHRYEGSRWYYDEHTIRICQQTAATLNLLATLIEPAPEPLPPESEAANLGHF